MLSKMEDSYEAALDMKLQFDTNEKRICNINRKVNRNLILLH